MTLPINLAIQKNKLEQSSPWVVLVEIDLDSTIGRFTNDNHEVIYDLNTYTPLPMEIGTITHNMEGGIPGLTLGLSNVNKAILPYIEELDGLVNSTLKLIVVNTAYLADSYAELTMNFTVLSCSVTDQWISFNLGAPSPLNQRYPIYRYLAKYCNWDFKGVECKYAGIDTECNKTHADCLTKDNLANFGGFYGLREDGFKVV